MTGRLAIQPPAGAVAPQRHPDAPPPGAEILSHYALCFACGADHPTGLHLRVNAGEGVSATATLYVGEHHQGAPGLAHGGLLATAFDETMGYVNWLLRVPAVTGRLETDFLHPVAVGSTLHITAEAVAVSGRKVFMTAEGRLDVPEGLLAVRAAAIFVQVPLEHFATHGRPEDVEAAALAAAATGQIRTYEVNP